MSCCGLNNGCNCNRCQGVKMSQFAQQARAASGQLIVLSDNTLVSLAQVEAYLKLKLVTTELVWPSYENISSDYAITEVTQCLAVDCTAGDVTVTLPALSAGNYNIKKVDASLNVVIIDAGANGSTLDGAASRNLTTRYDNLTINSDNNEWLRQ